MTIWLLSPLVSVVHGMKTKKPTYGICVLGTQLLAVTHMSSPGKMVSVNEFTHGFGAMDMNPPANVPE